MDTRFVGEGVLPHDGLVSRHLDAGDVGDEAAGRHQLLGRDPRGALVIVAPGAEGHHDLLQRAVARPLTQTVDRALDLTRSRLDRCQAVGHGEAQVVVAVRADHRLVDGGHAVDEALDHAVHVRRGRVADGVGDVDGRGTGCDHRLHHPAEKVDLRARRVFRGKLDVFAQVPRPGDAGHGPREHFLLRHPQLELAVDRTRRQEDVDPRLPGVPQRLPGPVDVSLVAPRQPADDRSLHQAGDVANALEVAR